ncbi:TRIC cation channel family protein [Calidifontibacter indicus]|uniref:TRIC cation channel family protein n=1 Tax=Calidifontibacter indicus TaxID=419650 RepID=UPI003D73C1E9
MRKYRQEIHANELLLLAYYIAAVNIESAFLDAKREAGLERQPQYESFPGPVLTDTFPSYEPGDRLDDNVFGGGMVRDVVLARRPAFLAGNTLYDTCAITASGVAIALNGLMTAQVGVLAATAVGAPMVLIAKARGWTLPGDSARVGVRAIKRRYPRQSS